MGALVQGEGLSPATRGPGPTIATIGDVSILARGPQPRMLAVMLTLFLATANAHKIAEIRQILGPTISCRSQRDAGVALEIDETGATFAENARLKSITWAAYLGTDVCNLGVEWVLADDSGLEVNALHGAPGVHSARFAALDDGRRGNTPDAENNAKLMRLLAGVPPEQRGARFRCVLALTPVRPGADYASLASATHCFDGACEGRIDLGASGAGGFGYDPLFIPEGYPASFAELGDAIKGTLSHRARALAQLAAHFQRH